VARRRPARQAGKTAGFLALRSVLTKAGEGDWVQPISYFVKKNRGITGADRKRSADDGLRACEVGWRTAIGRGRSAEVREWSATRLDRAEIERGRSSSLEHRVEMAKLRDACHPRGKSPREAFARGAPDTLRPWVYDWR
jgi:hypothetical protein